MDSVFSEKDYAKYQFLSGYQNALQKNPHLKLPITQFLESPYGKYVIEYTKYVLKSAIYPYEKQDKVSVSIDQEIASFPFAKMLLLSHDYNNILIDKFLEYKAKEIYKNLSLETDVYKIREIEKELGFGLKDVQIPVIEYTSLIPNMSRYNEKWKLMYRKIVDGNVVLDNATSMESRRIFLERIKLVIRRIFFDNKTVDKKYLNILKPIANEIFTKYKNSLVTDYGNVNTELFPPCIKALVGLLRIGENISHPARFTLVTFCYEIGMTLTEIVQLFEKVNNFNLELTMYQVKHIVSHDSEAGYKVPSCGTCRTNGICLKDTDALCNSVNHPLNYYIKKKIACGEKLNNNDDKNTNDSVETTENENDNVKKIESKFNNIFKL